MLGGLDPIIIFQLYKLTPQAQTTIATIPVTSGIKNKVTYAVIPIYLDENVSGLAVVGESKSIDINTENQSLSTGEASPINQKTLAAITSITFEAKSGSLVLDMLLALSELILDKTVSQEYEITYSHGAITVFGGLIHSFSYERKENTDLYSIKLEITRGGPKIKSVEVAQDPNAVRLGSSGATPAADAPKFSGAGSSGSSGGASVIQPGLK